MKKKQGFTLVEIMIVVVIIGLLAIMAIPAFTKVRATSQRNVVMNNLRQVSSAADQYFLETGNTTVNVSTLIATDGTGYLASLKPAAQENYVTAFGTINATQTEFSITVSALKDAKISWTNAAGGVETVIDSAGTIHYYK